MLQCTPDCALHASSINMRVAAPDPYVHIATMRMLDE